jgi:hypothetical protein
MRRIWLSLALVALTAALPPPTAAQPMPPPLELRLTTDRAAYTVGANVTLTLTVTNPTSDEVRLSFSSGQIYDFAVSSPGGSPVWRWGQGRAFLTAITSRSIPAGGSLTFTERWDQRNAGGLRVPTGVYVANAVLTTGGRPSAPPVLFVIGESQPLPGGCNQITSAFADNTPASLVAAAVEPRDALTGIWRFDGGRWQGWSSHPDAPNDLAAINLRDRIRVCLTGPARWITPV